jgi:hypothetical protein
MQCDAKKGDQETHGGENDGSEPSGLVPGCLLYGDLEFRVAGFESGIRLCVDLFKLRVATFDDGGEVFIYSGLHESGLGGGGGALPEFDELRLSAAPIL